MQQMCWTATSLAILSWWYCHSGISHVAEFYLSLFATIGWRLLNCLPHIPSRLLKLTKLAKSKFITKLINEPSATKKLQITLPKSGKASEYFDVFNVVLASGVRNRLVMSVQNRT